MMSAVLGRFSIAFQGDKHLNLYADLAAYVERYPFDTISLYNDLLFQPAFGPLLLMAQATRRVNLGVAAVNPFLCHPLTVAGEVALLDEISGGRAYLGVARGAWLDTIGLKARRAPHAIREFIEVVNHLLEGNSDAYQGDFFSLTEGATLRWQPPRPRVPIVLGTWGAKTVAATVHLMDDVKVGGSVNPAMVSQMRRYLQYATKATSRDENPIAVTMGAVCVVDEDGNAARRLARRALALYLGVVLDLDPTSPLDPEEAARVRAALARGDTEAAAFALSDASLLRFALAGTPADVVQQAVDLFDAGASRIEFGTPHGLTAQEGIRLLGERVLPALRE